MFQRVRTELGKFFFHRIIFLTETGSSERGREEGRSEKNNDFIYLSLL